MTDGQSQHSESNTPKYHAPKDKHCPYCAQPFTSSSLGRHLDLYIKEKNPRPPDGIHDVDAIREMRGSITRRHSRLSTGGRREVSTPVATPRGTLRKESTSLKDKDSNAQSAIPKDGQYAVDSTLSKYPFVHRWEHTGVINDIPSKSNWGAENTPDIVETSKRPAIQRTVSRQMAQKAQLDVKQKLSDAMDTARAAELALRELLSSWRAAKQHIDNNSMPFDFDPLSLDFPALTLQCLKPPPTLYSSTQHPTSTSWSVQSPGHREFGALKSYFQEEFRVWKIACASATTTATEELTYPPPTGPYKDVREAVKRAEKTADNLEKQVSEHLQSAYQVWDQLPAPRQQELWVLELARSVGRRHKDNVQLKDSHHKLKQECANLKLQIDQLNRLQQPKEFKLLSPTTVPIDQDVLTYAYEQGVKGGKSIGFNIEDRHEDLTTVVTKSIERWKNVITSTRTASSGMSGQKPLGQGLQSPVTGDASAQQRNLSQLSGSQLQHETSAARTMAAASISRPESEPTGTSTTTDPPSVEDMSDQDADAEMEDDDSFAIMNASPTKTPVPLQQQSTLNIPRTRIQQRQQQQVHQPADTVSDSHFLMQGGADEDVTTAAISMSRSMPNMNLAMQGDPMHGADMSMGMPGVRGNSMYME